MPAKEINLPQLGKVKLYKRRGIKAIRMTLHSDGYIRVTLPKWLPYAAGIEFVKSKQDWISQHKRPKALLEEGQLIGKRHRLFFIKKKEADSTSSRLNDNSITVYYHEDYSPNHHQVQEAARKAALRALKKEAQELLPMRLRQLSLESGITYNLVKVMRLKARWGSCSSQKNITLSIFLVQLPWELIDYVIMHELIHTKVHNHGPDFWQEFGLYYDSPKKYRKMLKDYQPSI